MTRRKFLQAALAAFGAAVVASLPKPVAELLDRPDDAVLTAEEMGRLNESLKKAHMEYVRGFSDVLLEENVLFAKLVGKRMARS